MLSSDPSKKISNQIQKTVQFHPDTRNHHPIQSSRALYLASGADDHSNLGTGPEIESAPGVQLENEILCSRKLPKPQQRAIEI